MRVYSDVLKASAVSLLSHMQWYCLAISILPVAYTGWNFPVLHVFGSQLPGYLAVHHGRLVSGALGTFLCLCLGVSRESSAKFEI
jgi:hypothetical protein